MIIGKIEDGIVLDHIKAGRGMELYRILGLDNLDCQVALIKNADSGKMGRKDIIKIDRIIDIDLDAIGYVDPGITVNIIKGGELAKRTHIDLPEEITNVIHCKKSECTGAYTVKVRRNKAPGSECRDAGWAAGHCGSTEIV